MTHTGSESSGMSDDLLSRYTTAEDAGLASPTLCEVLGRAGLSAKVDGLGQWWKATRIARALARFTQSNGPLLTGGMALTTLVSLTAALTVAVTGFMLLLGDNEQLRSAFFSSIETVIPNLFITDDSPQGLVDPSVFILSDALSITGCVALIVMVWTTMGVVGQLGHSIRAMFSIGVLPGSPLTRIFRNALGAGSLAVGLVLSAGLSVVVTFAGDWLLESIGLTGTFVSTLLLRILTESVGFLMYILVTWMIIHVVAAVRVPRRDLVSGLIIIGAISMVLRILGTSVVGSVRGPLLATATTLITVVLWINLQVRVVLMVCAWMANPPRPFLPDRAVQMHFDETPNYVTLSAPHTLSWPHSVVSGEIMPDDIHEASLQMLGKTHI